VGLAALLGVAGILLWCIREVDPRRWKSVLFGLVLLSFLGALGGVVDVSLLVRDGGSRGGMLARGVLLILSTSFLIGAVVLRGFLLHSRIPESQGPTHERMDFDLRRGFEDVQRISRLGYWDWGITDNTLHWSDETYRLFGLKPQAFGATYDAFLERVHPEDRQAVIQAVDEAVYNKAPYSIDHRVVRPDGTLRWVHEQGEVTFNDKGEPVRMLGTVHDVTDRLRGEAKLRALLEMAPDPILVTDVAGRVVLANRQADQLFGYTRSEMIGEQIEVFIPVEHASDDEEPDNPLPAADSLNLRGVRKDGSEFPVEISLGSIKTEDGLLMAANIRDITERRADERRQRRMMDELNHRVKNNLSAVLSLASQTIDHSESLDAFKEGFLGRLRTMATAHEALALNRWDGAEASGLIKRVLLRPGVADRVILQGAESGVNLPADAVTPVAMVLHEMLTNAQRHGSLSNETGTLRVSWRRTVEGVFVLEWEEQGGPSVTIPSQRGTGMNLIYGLFEYQLTGEVEMDFTPLGLRATFRVMLWSDQSVQKRVDV
jgi:PAS domain S-box-containing protein